MTGWLGIGPRFRRVLGATLILTIVVGVTYAFFGHRLIEEIYRGNHPIEHVIHQADRVVYGQVLPFPLLNLVFYYFLYRAFAYLVRKSRRREIGGLPRFGFKCDWALAAVLYLACTYLFFQPQMGSLGSHLIGPAEDNQEYLWDMWWGQQVLGGAGGLTHTNMIFYPEGTTLLFSTYSFYNLLLSLLLVPVLGLVASYNVLILHSFVLSGLSAFFLIRYLVRDSIAATVGGFIFAFSPSHFAQALHHMHVLSIQFLPLFVLFFIKTVRGESRWDPLWTALFFLLAALCDWYYMVFNLYFIAFCYTYLAVKRGRFLLRDIIRKSALAIAPALLLLSPWLYRMILLVVRNPQAASGGGHGAFVADLAGFVIPHSWHPLGKLPFLRAANSSYTGNLWESTAYLGLAALALIVVARKRLVASGAPYFAGMLAFAVLSLGTYVHILGHKTQIVLPYSLLKHVPVLASVRAPGRNIVFVYLFLAVVVGMALRLLRETRMSKAAYGAVIAVACLALFADYHSRSADKTAVRLPACYQVIQQAKGDFGILDLPGKYQDWRRYMAYQTIHGLPIVQGGVARKFGQTLVDRLNWNDLKAQRQQLAESRVKYIVVHKHLVSDQDGIDMGALGRHYRVAYEDSDCTVFEVY